MLNCDLPSPGPYLKGLLKLRLRMLELFCSACDSAFAAAALCEQQQNLGFKVTKNLS